MKNEINHYPKISIITCIYNGAKYISKLFESIINMGYPNIEHIIVDDGSTDDTYDVVQKYKKIYNDTKDTSLSIIYIKQENMGLGGATNTGLKAITGDYWTWINCDDWYEKNAFNIVMEHFNNKKVEMVLINRYKAFINNGHTTKEILMPESTQNEYNSDIKIKKAYYRSKRNFLHYLVKTSSFDRINPSRKIDPLRWTQDAQLYAILIGNLHVSYEQKPLVNYYVHEDSMYFREKNMDEVVLNSTIKTFDYLKLQNNKIKNQTSLIIAEYNYLHYGQFDSHFLDGNKKLFRKKYKELYGKYLRNIPYRLHKYTRKELVIKYKTSFLPFFWKISKKLRK